MTKGRKVTKSVKSGEISKRALLPEGLLTQKAGPIQSHRETQEEMEVRTQLLLMGSLCFLFPHMKKTHKKPMEFITNCHRLIFAPV